MPRRLQGGDFAKQVSSYDISNLKERTGARVYAGELDVTSRLNEDVTTAFPIAEAIPKLQPGVYVLAASAVTKKEENEGYRQLATQWFIVSDLGLTAINGDDGLHAFVRSLAGATPVVECQPAPRRPQQRGARHRQDRQPRLCAASTPASSAARADRRRPCWSPTRPTATTPSSTYRPPPST